MANSIFLTVMAPPAAPALSSGPDGLEYGTLKPNGAISENELFIKERFIRVKTFFQPTSGTTYPLVNSIVTYQSINKTNGINKVVRMYVNQTPAAIQTLLNT